MNLKAIKTFFISLIIMVYKCEYCEHEFKQSGDLKRHLTKMNSCIPTKKILEIAQDKTEKSEKVSNYERIR